MEPLSFSVYKAFQKDLLKAISNICAANDSGDGHTYEHVTLNMRPLKVPNKPNIIASITLNIEVSFDDWGAEEPFEDDYSFRFVLFANGKIGSQPLHVPLTQSQVYESYRTWGNLLQVWVDGIKAHYDIVVRKVRFAPVHEELIAKMWHPDRVAALLEKGGWDLLEAM